jgi:hypothetical protein
MLFKPRGTENAVESRARDQARWLIRDHGDEAEAVLAAKRRRSGVSAADLYRYKLTARELKRLRRHGDDVEAGTAGKTPLLSPARLLHLLGLRAGPRRKRSRD